MRTKYIKVGISSIFGIWADNIEGRDWICILCKLLAVLVPPPLTVTFLAVSSERRENYCTLTENN